MNLLAVSHWKQRRQADCLVACTAISIAEFNLAWYEEKNLTGL